MEGRLVTDEYGYHGSHVLSSACVEGGKDEISGCLTQLLLYFRARIYSLDPRFYPQK